MSASEYLLHTRKIAKHDTKQQKERETPAGDMRATFMPAGSTRSTSARAGRHHEKVDQRFIILQGFPKPSAGTPSRSKPDAGKSMPGVRSGHRASTKLRHAWARQPGCTKKNARKHRDASMSTVWLLWIHIALSFSIRICADRHNLH